MAKKPPPVPESGRFIALEDFVWDEAHTPLSTTPSELAVQEQIRYKNYASSDAMVRCLDKLARSTSHEDTKAALRAHWVEGVDWGAKWQDNQTRLAHRKLDRAIEHARKLNALLKQYRNRESAMRSELERFRKMHKK